MTVPPAPTPHWRPRLRGLADRVAAVDGVLDLHSLG